MAILSDRGDFRDERNSIIGYALPVYVWHDARKSGKRLEHPVGNIHHRGVGSLVFVKAFDRRPDQHSNFWVSKTASVPIARAIVPAASVKSVRDHEAPASASA